MPAAFHWDWRQVWQQRLADENEVIRQIAAFALLRQVVTAGEMADRTMDYSYFLLPDWQPVEETVGPVAEAMEVVRAWLKVSLHNNSWGRRMAWRQLIRWDRAEILTDWGIDLLPHVEMAVQMEKDGRVLLELAHWMPGTRLSGTVRPASDSFLFQKLKIYWQVYRQSRDWQNRASGWLGGIGLHEAGLAAEPPENFRESYLSAVAGESHADVLFVLTQWSPAAEVSAAFHWDWRQVWQQRLADENGVIRQVAAFALLRQAVTASEMAEQLAPDGKGWDMAGRRRWLRDFLRSYGQTAGGDEGNDRTVEFMNSILNSLWTKLNGGLFSGETTGGRGRAEALIFGGPGAVFVHPQRDRVSPVEAPGSFTESQAVPVPGAVPGRSPFFAG